MTDAVGHALHNPLRKRIIEALWHSSEALSAENFYREYVSDGEPITLAMVVYHVRQLNHDGILEFDTEAPEVEHRAFVLSGPNSSEAIRRLGLTPPPEPA